jgi:hypothetical protein
MRLFATLFALLATTAIAAPSARAGLPLVRPQITADDAANGTTVTGVAGEDVVVTLVDHGDGGFRWSVEEQSAFGLGVETHVPGRPHVLGDFGKDVFTFSTAGFAAGTYEVDLIDQRPGSASPAFLYRLTVNLVGAN